jgi:hypothetical protein
MEVDMLVVSPADFKDNFRTYREPVRIEENGVTLGKFIPKTINVSTLLFRKQEKKPSKELLAAIKEAEELERNPNTKRYTDMAEMWADLNK